MVDILVMGYASSISLAYDNCRCLRVEKIPQSSISILQTAISKYEPFRISASLEMIRTDRCYLSRAEGIS